MFGRSTVVAKKQEKHKNSLDNSRKIGNTQMQAQFASQKKKASTEVCLVWHGLNSAAKNTVRTGG